MAVNKSEFALHLADKRPGHEQILVILPGDEIPAWALKDITNPYVLGDQVVESGGDSPGGDPAGPPPKAGKGSGEDKWRAYAEEHKIDVTDLNSRDEIIDRLHEAGIPVE